jgi:ABC-type Mn2+/Zn2+ transport system permease subunit
MNPLEAHRLLVEHFPWALFAAVALGALLPVAGSFLAMRRSPLFAVALPQSAFAGTALGLWGWSRFHGPHADGVDHEPSAMFLRASAAAAVAATAALLAWRSGRGPAADGGSRAAVVFVAALALGESFRALAPLGEQRLEPLLHGELIAMGRGESLWTVAVVGAVVATLLAFRRPILFASAEPAVAAAAGVRVDAASIALHACVAAVVAASVPTVGPLFALAGLVAPPLLLRRSSRSVGAALRGAAFAGATGAYGGALFAASADIPLGAAAALGVAAASGLWAFLRDPAGFRRDR